MEEIRPGRENDLLKSRGPWVVSIFAWRRLSIEPTINRSNKLAQPLVMDDVRDTEVREVGSDASECGSEVLWEVSIIRDVQTLKTLGS